MLQIQSITFGYQGRLLFEEASAHVPVGHRVALVGDNGSGKTTLLRLILGQEPLDRGTIQVRARSRVGIVSQEAPGGDQTPLDWVLAQDKTRTALLREAETATDPTRIAEIHTALADRGAHAAPARAAEILAGLGFDEQAQGRPLAGFSGGFRMRVALAASLFCEPDLLLLDEPTNHLDLESSLWLQGYLKSYPRTLLLVSHDRYLLTHAVNHILHLSGGKLEMFQGGYEQFERVWLERLAHNASAARQQSRERERIEAFIARNRASKTRARQAQSRIKLLARIEPVQALVQSRRPHFHFPDPESPPSPVLRLDEVSVGYGSEPPVLERLGFSLFAGDRIALIGANGNGKTTLARLLSGALAPRTGEIHRSAKTRVGYFAQDSLEQLDPEQTPLEALSTLNAEATQTALRTWLGRFGFGETLAELRVRNLSGGEKTRLALSLIAWERPNLLILDEPTNHLDMRAREGLIEALGAYSGALVLISHDRHLVEATADQLWIVRDGTTAPFFGDLDDYQAYLAERARARRTDQRSVKTALARGDRKAIRQDRALARARIAPIRSRVRAAEATIERLGDEIARIDALLSRPETYARNGDELKGLVREKRALQDELSEAESHWLEAQAELETLLALESEDPA